jgi:hypothetical protein
MACKHNKALRKYKRNQEGAEALSAYFYVNNPGGIKNTYFRPGQGL